MKGNYDDYEHVKAEVIYAAAHGDEDAYNIIFKRFEGYIGKMIVSYIRGQDMPVSYFPVEDLKHSVWIDLRDRIKKYQPR